MGVAPMTLGGVALRIGPRELAVSNAANARAKPSRTDEGYTEYSLLLAPISIDDDAAVRTLGDNGRQTAFLARAERK